MALSSKILRAPPLARQFGIDGFCYYHYWFTGNQLLKRPVAEILSSGKPDFPFCLCWANENWSRRWHGPNQEVLIAHHYSPADDLAHIQALLPYFHDPRYIRIQNKPLFLVYRSSALPDPRATPTLWRKQAHASGLKGPLSGKSGVLPHRASAAPRARWLRRRARLQPVWGSLPSPRQPPRRWKLLNKLGLARSYPFRTNRVFSYLEVVAAMQARPPVDYPRFPCVVSSWDSTARRCNGAAAPQATTGADLSAVGVELMDWSKQFQHHNDQADEIHRQRAFSTSRPSEGPAQLVMFLILLGATESPLNPPEHCSFDLQTNYSDHGCFSGADV